MDLEPRTIGNVIYVHYTTLQQWGENKEARILHDKDWRRLLSSVRENGVKEKAEVGNDGIIYDGNHRWEAVKYLIETEGLTTAANGVELAWLPVTVSDPQTDAEKLALVVRGNDKDFAIYNKEWLMNNQERLQQVPGWEDISVDVEEPMTLSEAYDWPDEDSDNNEEEDQDDASSSDDESDDGEPEKPKAASLVTKEVTCPNCSHTFIFKP